jgi:hypothetical protein
MTVGAWVVVWGASVELAVKVIASVVVWVGSALPLVLG